MIFLFPCYTSWTSHLKLLAGNMDSFSSMPVLVALTQGSCSSELVFASNKAKYQHKATFGL